MKDLRARVTPNETTLLEDLTTRICKLETQLAKRYEQPPTHSKNLFPKDLDELPWIEGYVRKTNPTVGYACLLPCDGPANAERVHCLSASAPREVRESLKVGDLIAYKAQRDRKGLRVVALQKH